MGRCGQHGQWTGLAALDILAVIGLQGNAEAFRAASHLIQGYKPIVLVEGRVLDPLGHDRAGDLLKTLHKIEPGLLVLVEHGAWKAQ